LNLQCDYFPRPGERGEYQRYHAAARAQLEHACGWARGGKAGQQHRLDRESVAAARLVKT